jgi:hypothetical protein
MFDPLRKPFAASGINVVTWDARGHGGTRTRRDEPFTYWDLASDALVVLNVLGVERGRHRRHEPGWLRGAAHRPARAGQSAYEPNDSVVGVGAGQGVRMPRKNWTLPG